MQLKPYKTRRGFVLDLARNRERLDFWKERYGITDEDIKGEDVNIVNDVNDISQEPLAEIIAEKGSGFSSESQRI